MTVFHPYFIYVDQYLEILPQTIQSVLVTSAFMMVVSFIMIPNPLCSLWVAFSILSIEAGVVGYMTWWGVNLDGIALINLIMCIGFSVDFSAHICYHYMSEEGKSPEERISASLYALGLPIIQGWKFMSCSHCQEFGKQKSWLLIGFTGVNNQSGARSAS